MPRKPKSKQATPGYHKLEQKGNHELAAYAKEQRGLHRYKKARKAEQELERRGCDRGGDQRIRITVPEFPPGFRWDQ